MGAEENGAIGQGRFSTRAYILATCAYTIYMYSEYNNNVDPCRVNGREILTVMFLHLELCLPTLFHRRAWSHLVYMYI